MSEPVRQWQGLEPKRSDGGHASGSASPMDSESALSARLKEQARETAKEAQSTVAALADEARARLEVIVDQQKALGADHVAGVARAVHTVADDLDQSSPQLARLVKSAAMRVDKFADTIRGRDLGDLAASISAFGQRQPLVLFGGAVAAGFVLARFLKSDTPTSLGSGEL